MPSNTRLINPLIIDKNKNSNIAGSLRTLFMTMIHKFFFLKEQCWEFDFEEVSKILSRYSSKHAEIFKFIPAFAGKENNADLYQ